MKAVIESPIPEADRACPPAPFGIPSRAQGGSQQRYAADRRQRITATMGRCTWLAAATAMMIACGAGDDGAPSDDATTPVSFRMNLDSQAQEADTYCAEDSDTCVPLPDSSGCDYVEIRFESGSGRTCEVCGSESGAIREQCTQPDIACTAVTIPDPDCVVCAHVGGSVVHSTCQQPERTGCFYNGLYRALNDSFTATDGCNHCTCTEDGSVACTERACPTQCVADMDCVQAVDSDQAATTAEDACCTGGCTPQCTDGVCGAACNDVPRCCYSTAGCDDSCEVAASECAVDADCGAGLVCEPGPAGDAALRCVPGCHEDSQCLQGEQCSDEMHCLTTPCPGVCAPSVEPQRLCESTGGRWDESACGHSSCGGGSISCMAIIPGCDCGNTSNFDPDSGCTPEPMCTNSDK